MSFVIPCLNEAGTIASVIADCQIGGERTGEPYEIIVADNGSTDGSQAIAEAGGARVVPASQRGYGAALITGIHAARGTYVLMGDADSTYDFREAPAFLAKLQQGYDLVMGNRFQGKIAPGAMPLLHRYLGNPVLSSLGRLFFGIKIGDFHCGLRAFDRKAILNLSLQCTGMEYASEMVIKSSLMELRASEIPTLLRPNPPGRTPHLKTWRDGWRHLKFMLSFAPKYSLLPLALILILLSVSLAGCFVLKITPFTGSNTLIFSASLAVAATSIFTDYLLTREMIYAHFSSSQSRYSRLVDRILGLNHGTDRLFKIAGCGILASIFFFFVLAAYAKSGALASPAAAFTGLLASSGLLSSVLIYLTATKITSYRSVHPKLRL